MINKLLCQATKVAEATDELNKFIGNEFMMWFVENYPQLKFEYFNIGTRFISFELDTNIGKHFLSESSFTLLGYNVDLCVYENNSNIEVQFSFPDIQEMVDIEGNFVLYPPDILDWLATNEDVKRDYLAGDSRQYGINMANQHIAQINQLIDYYKRKF